MFDRLVFNKHLEKGEKILYVIHRHWISLVKSTVEVGFFGFVIPWGLYLMGFNSELFFWIAVVWSFLAYLRLMFNVINWHSDAILITDRSLLHVIWDGFFNNQSVRVGYEDIEGVQYEINGFLGTLLRYGDFTLRLNSGNNYDVPKASSPKKAELAIAKYQEQVMSSKNMQDADGLKSLLSDLVSYHVKQKTK